MTHANAADTKAEKWKKIFIHEMSEYLINFAFLVVFLLAFTWYRRLILAEYRIQYLAYWAPFIEAAILAKIIMIGDAIHVGRRLKNQPLALIALYRTIAFSLLVMLFCFAEHIVESKIHGGTVADGIAEITNKGIYEILAWCVVFFAAFLPFFLLKEIENAFGTEKVRRMLYKKPRHE